MRSAWARWLSIAALCVGVASVAWATPPSPPAERLGHGSITEQLDCSACHTPQGWRDASAAGAATGFDHDRTGFPLRGRHARAACTDCHAADVTITRECSGCHEDSHRGRLGVGCDDCHDSVDWQRTAAIELHRKTRLPLSGMHAIADCTDCHRRSVDHVFDGVPADCYACHADDYRRSDVHPAHAGDAEAMRAPFDRDCAACHRASGWTPAVIPIGGLGRELSRAAPRSHELRFPIRSGPHRGSACADCHTRADGGGPVQCRGCHAHDASALARAHPRQRVTTDGRGCLSCHPGGSTR